MKNQLMHGIFAASLCSTWLAIAIIATRKIITRFVGPLWQHYIWFTIFIPWFFIWTPLYFLSVPAVLIIYTFIKPFILMTLHHTTFLAKLFFLITNGSKYSFILTKLYFILWLIGTILFFAYILFRHLQFITVLKNSSRELSLKEKGKVARSLNNFQMNHISKIYLADALSSALICHVLNPKIYLPNNFFQYYTPAEQKYILQHEFFHFKRGDLFANGIMLLLWAINWFNPMMIFIYHYFRTSQELSCDAIVSKGFSLSEKKAYGYTLIKTAINKTSDNLLVNCWWNTGIELKERCRMLRFNHSRSIKALFGLGILIFMIGISLATVCLNTRDALFAYSIFSAKGSDFVIKIFNNTDFNKPLHYRITSSTQDPVEGEVTRGDDNGEFITITGLLNDNTQAEITVDVNGKFIWVGMISFSKKNRIFHNKLIRLDSYYTLRTNVFSKLQVISFDICNAMDKLHGKP